MSGTLYYGPLLWHSDERPYRLPGDMRLEIGLLRPAYHRPIVVKRTLRKHVMAGLTKEYSF